MVVGLGRGAATSRGIDPRHAGLLSVQGRRRTGAVRGQGQVAALPAEQLLRVAGDDASPHGADGGVGRDGRVDPGPQRRRGDHAGVQPDQAAPAPFQRAPGRRQELPVPGRHAGRRLAPSDGHAGAHPQRRAPVRSLRPRVRHPRDARPAAAHVPDPHLLGQQAPPPRAAGQAVPALPHREVRGSVCGRDRPRRLRRAGRGAAGLPRRRHRRRRQQARERDARRCDRAGVRAGRPPPRSAHQRAPGHREAADGGRALGGSAT